MKPSFPSLIVLILCVTCLSVGSILLKMGMNRYDTLTASGVPSLPALVRSPQLSVGMVLMLAQFFGTLALFRWGWDASVVVPCMGLCYVGTAILGQWFLGEPVNALRWIGIALVLFGVFCIARSVVPDATP